MESPVDLGLHIAADISGFVGSILLTVTAWQAIPLQGIVDSAEGADPDKPGGHYIIIAKDLAQADLSGIRAGERRYMIAGAVFLAAGFLCSIVAHFA